MNPGTSTIHDQAPAHPVAGDSLRGETGPRRGRVSDWFAASSRALADGFLGGLLGGSFYLVAVAYFQPGGLRMAGLQVLALSLTLAGFEVWRTRRPRSFRDLKRALLWILMASFLVFGVIGLVVPPPEPVNTAPRPHVDYGFFVRYI
jgi:hypothetical protein